MTAIERGAEAIRVLEEDYDFESGHFPTSEQTTRAVFESIDADALEQSLVREWHEDQCACRDFDGVDIETCYTRQVSGFRFCPPTSWGVDHIKAHLLSEGGES